MDDLQALQQEAMKRLADILADVQESLAEAEKALMEKYFNDPDPMPVFVFQAKDALSMAGLTAYYSKCLIAGLRDHAAEVNKAMQDFREWQRRNPDRMKLPDKQHVGLPIRKAFEDIERPAPGDPIRGEMIPDRRQSELKNFYKPDNTICCTLAHPCSRHEHFANPDNYANPTRPIRDNPQA